MSPTNIIQSEHNETNVDRGDFPGDIPSPVRNLHFPEIQNYEQISLADPVFFNKRRSATPDQLNASLSTSKLNTTPGGSLKCQAKTKTGGKCRKSAFGCSDMCWVHTPKK